MDVVLIHRIGVDVCANHSSIMSNEVPSLAPYLRDKEATQQEDE